MESSRKFSLSLLSTRKIKKFILSSKKAIKELNFCTWRKSYYTRNTQADFEGSVWSLCLRYWQLVFYLCVKDKTSLEENFLCFSNIELWWAKKVQTKKAHFCVKFAIFRIMFHIFRTPIPPPIYLLHVDVHIRILTVKYSLFFFFNFPNEKRRGGEKNTLCGCKMSKCIQNNKTVHTTIMHSPPPLPPLLMYYLCTPISIIHPLSPFLWYSTHVYLKHNVHHLNALSLSLCGYLTIVF